MRLHCTHINNEATLLPHQQGGYTAPTSTMRLHCTQLNNETTLPPSHQWGDTTSKSSMRLHYLQVNDGATPPQVNHEAAVPSSQQPDSRSWRSALAEGSWPADSPATFRGESALTLSSSGRPGRPRGWLCAAAFSPPWTAGQHGSGCGRSPETQHGAVVRYTLHGWFRRLVVNTHRQHGAVVQYILHGWDGCKHTQTAWCSGSVHSAWFKWL